jgi:hypothetical protein
VQLYTLRMYARPFAHPADASRDNVVAIRLPTALEFRTISKGIQTPLGSVPPGWQLEPRVNFFIG